MRKYLLILTLLALQGCGTAGTTLMSDGQRKVSMNDDRWEKAGADMDEIQKAMLECGMYNFESLRREYRHLPNWTNDTNLRASAQQSMKREGFAEKSGYESTGLCRNFPDLSACQARAPVQRRSVQRRLESCPCRSYRNFAVCKP